MAPIPSTNPSFLYSKAADVIEWAKPVIGIIKALKLAKKQGLTIPIIYNTSSYENLNTIKMLNGLIDVYLPDFKYFDNKYAIKYSKAYNYQEVTKEVIKEMYQQVGKCQFKKGNIQKGVIVRHLMLPGLKEDTKKILKYLYETYQDNIYLSLICHTLIGFLTDIFIFLII